MEYSSSDEILAEASRFEEDLKNLVGSVDLPRDDLLRHLQALQTSFASLQLADCIRHLKCAIALSPGSMPPPTRSTGWLRR